MKLWEMVDPANEIVLVFNSKLNEHKDFTVALVETSLEVGINHDKVYNIVKHAQSKKVNEQSHSSDWAFAYSRK